MPPLGTVAPAFEPPDHTGRVVSRDDFAGSPALLIMFLCNHCPYVKHVAAEVAQLAREYQARGVAVAAISSNDVA
jgi:Peroxiredoxin